MIYPSTQSKFVFPEICRAENKYIYSKDRIYLDFVGGNNTIVLGHKKYTFDYCPNFSGPSFLEAKTSEVLSSFTRTDHFRYFKNGSDAVSCALRLSRHLLKKSPNKAKVLFIGYGGVSNEYVSTLNDNGVPASLCTQLSVESFTGLKDSYDFYDIIVFESRYRTFADIIPARFKICDHLKSGVLGLFEETYDFDLYGKSLGNGYPIAVLTGRDELMLSINDIYYSTTFGGENTGLEAINKTLKEFVPLKDDYVEFLEYAKLTLSDWQRIDSDTIERFLERGFFFNGYWQLMTCHTRRDVDMLAKLCDELM